MLKRKYPHIYTEGMGQWSENALARLRREVASAQQRSEVLLRNDKIIEAKAPAYWERLVSDIKEELGAFCAGSLELRPLGLREHDVPSASNPTFRIERLEYPRGELWLELVVSGRMIKFTHKTQAAWDGEQLSQQGMFCLRVDDQENIYLTHGGVTRTEDEATAILLDPIVFPICVGYRR